MVRAQQALRTFREIAGFHETKRGQRGRGQNFALEEDYGLACVSKLSSEVLGFHRKNPGKPALQTKRNRTWNGAERGREAWSWNALSD
jgi:hypothetical protein